MFKCHPQCITPRSRHRIRQRRYALIISAILAGGFRECIERKRRVTLADFSRVAGNATDRGFSVCCVADFEIPQFDEWPWSRDADDPGVWLICIENDDDASRNVTPKSRRVVDRQRRPPPLPTPMPTSTSLRPQAINRSSSIVRPRNDRRAISLSF